MIDRREFKIKVIETKISEYSVFADNPRMAEAYHETGKTKFLNSHEGRKLEISEIKQKKEEQSG